WLNKTGFLQIQKQPFIFCRYDFVAPMMRFSFVANTSSKHGERVTMIAVAGDHLPSCVTTCEKDRKDQSDSTPLNETRQSSCCGNRPVGGLFCFNRGRRTARRARARGIAQRELRGEQQTERRNHRENSVHAF